MAISGKSTTELYAPAENKDPNLQEWKAYIEKWNKKAEEENISSMSKGKQAS